jgi:hypothetical protein
VSFKDGLFCRFLNVQLLTCFCFDGKTELYPCSQCPTKAKEPPAINLEAFGLKDTYMRFDKGKIEIKALEMHIHMVWGTS